MAGSLETRLDRVEQGLTPQQAIVLWLEETHQHGSLLAFVAWLKEQPAGEGQG